MLQADGNFVQQLKSYVAYCLFGGAAHPAKPALSCLLALLPGCCCCSPLLLPVYLHTIAKATVEDLHFALANVMSTS